MFEVIEVAGVLHADPLGLDRLRSWLSSLSFTDQSTPGFVAVEYKCSHLSQIVRQRTTFRELVEGQWPFLRPEGHTMFERSLGHDGDAHRDILPYFKTLWLEEKLPGEELAEYAKRRLSDLRFYTNSISQKDEEFLLELSRRLWDSAVNNRFDQPNKRDETWSELIIDRARCEVREHAVAIVGQMHARREIPDSFVYRLEKAKIRCRVKILCPSNG